MATTKSKDPAARLGPTRLEIAAKREEIALVEGALLPIEEAAPQLRNWRQANASQCDLTGLHYFATPDYHGRGFTLATLVDRSTNTALAESGLPSVSDDVSSLLCAVLGEQLEDFLVARLEKHLAAQPLVLGAAEKTERLATLRRELVELEVAEEKLIRELEDRGAFVARRSDAEPCVVLAFDLDRVLAEAA